MMTYLDNPWRGVGLPEDVVPGASLPSVAAERPQHLLTRCPASAETPLVSLSGVGTEIWIKDERGRMGLGSFKALGAAYVIAYEAAETGAADLGRALTGRTFVTASAGNHGMSVAAGAGVFGADAVIYIAETVPESFAERLRAKGAKVVREGAEYEASMHAAAHAAQEKGWTLLSDSSWEGYFELPHRLMEGYLVMAAEAAQQMPDVPTHIFLQAGVGGLAGACAAYFREILGEAPKIIVVEPEAAPALLESIKAGQPVFADGPVSSMGRLDCKEPSWIALKGLAQDADAFVTITEDEAAAILPVLADAGLTSTPSGAAGVAAAVTMGLSEDARVLCILSEMDDT